MFYQITYHLRISENPPRPQNSANVSEGGSEECKLGGNGYEAFLEKELKSIMGISKALECPNKTWGAGSNGLSYVRF